MILYVLLGTAEPPRFRASLDAVASSYPESPPRRALRRLVARFPRHLDGDSLDLRRIRVAGPEIARTHGEPPGRLLVLPLLRNQSGSRIAEPRRLRNSPRCRPSE